jgi:hypothetical protein
MLWKSFRETGTWASVQAASLELFGEVEKTVEASLQDDKKDENGDGIPDVLQVSPALVVQRKLVLFAKNADPKKITDSITAISAG